MVTKFLRKTLCIALSLSILVSQVASAVELPFPLIPISPPAIVTPVLSSPIQSSPAVLFRNKNHFEPEQGAGDKFPSLSRWEFTNGNIIKTERQADELASAWQTTEFTYDILNKLKTVKDPLNRVTTYNYDNNENLASVVDAELNTTSYTYDERDLLFTVDSEKLVLEIAEGVAKL